MSRPPLCDRCGGTGLEPWDGSFPAPGLCKECGQWRDCPDCRDRRVLAVLAQLVSGGIGRSVHVSVDCPTCGGSGRVRGGGSQAGAGT